MTESKVLYSPLCEARWVNLIDPRPQMDPDKPKAWTCDLVLPKDDPKTEAFVQRLEEALVAEHGPKKRRSDKGFPIKPDKNDPSKLVCKFKSQQNQKSDGSFWPGPKLIDAKKQAWDGRAIGNGSKLVIAFKVNAWDRPEGVGITLIPTAAQVVHFVPYIEDDGVDGFEEQEGFTVPSVADEFDEFGGEDPGF
jgi:hypothetical protein